jgi:hypothetical protein
MLQNDQVFPKLKIEFERGEMLETHPERKSAMQCNKVKIKLTQKKYSRDVHFFPNSNTAAVNSCQDSHLFSETSDHCISMH